MLLFAILAAFASGTSQAAGEISLSGPQGLTFDAKDNLYVADTGNHRVLVFGPDLSLRRTIGGGPGVGDGRFNEPFDVAVDSKGRVIVADTRNHRIQVFDASGGFLFAFGRQGQADGELNGPSNVTVDDRDNLIVTDRWNHRLQVFDRTGKHLFTLANETGEKSAARMEQERQWALADGKRPEEVAVNPRWENTDVGQCNEPGGTFFDGKLKRVYLANGWNCRLEVFDYDSATGKLTRRGPREGIIWGFWLTRSVTGDAQGNLYGCDTNFGNINIFANRASLNNESQRARTESGGAYGAMRNVTDIAINSKGDVAVADAGNNRIVIFDKEFSKPGSPRISQRAATTATIEWKTRSKSRTAAIYRQSDICELTPGNDRPWETEKVTKVEGRGAETTTHKLMLTGLEPGKRYFYKLRMPDARTIPGGGWSREYAIATMPPKGQMAYVHIPVKLLLVANVMHTESLRPDTPWPTPMPASEVHTYREAIDETVLFYWMNSAMRYFTDVTFVVDSTMYRSGRIASTTEKLTDNTWRVNGGSNFGFETGMKGKLCYLRDGASVVVADAEVTDVEGERATIRVDDVTEEVRPGLSFLFEPRYLALPEQNHDKSFAEGLRSLGRDNQVWTGQVIVECERRWNPGRREWHYQGSGGGTYGVEWPTPGRSFFLGGSDIAWLMCHEFKHQIESQYNNSGLDREDDRMWFCHFAPKYDNPDPAIGTWQWDTAAKHGEHWDGIAWQFRHMNAGQWMRNMYGEVRLAKDSDGDGIPDDAPHLPMDEKRFGSDPAKVDTDNDGLSDMREVLASTWVTALNTDIRVRTGREYIRPNPRHADTDEDGVPDGKDKYPLYPFATTVSAGEVEVDGTLGEWPTTKPWVWMESHGIRLNGWSTYDADYLYFAFEMSGPWTRISIVTDQNADGFYCGNDNVYVRVVGDKTNGPRLESARVHLCAMNRWPYFDDKQEHFRQDDTLFAGSVSDGKQVFEMAIPRNPRLGLDLKKGEEIGLMVYVGLENGASLALFEPWAIFDFELR
ncbi:MAG: hypothetical protein HRF45_10265 [Fimbriimonadia bacterium]|jgi:hypothetical protein